MRLLTALLRPFEWLFGTRGDAFYRATCRTASWPEFCSQIEAVVRTHFPSERGFVVHPVHQKYACFVHVYQGLTSGFSVGLVPKSEPGGEVTVSLWGSRWSRLHSWGIQIATACFFLALLACIGLAAWKGWVIPFIGIVIAAVALLVTILVMRLLFFGITALTRASDTGALEEQLTAVVAAIQAVVEENQEVSIPLE